MRGDRPEVAFSLILIGRPGTSDENYISYIQAAMERGLKNFYLLAGTDHGFERANLVAEVLCQEGKLMEIERKVIDPKKRQALVKRGIPTPVGIIYLHTQDSS